MKILQVNLVTHQIEEMKEYYTNMLEMKLSFEREDSFAVWAGNTRLVFQSTEEQPYYHLCFRTNDRYFEEMYKKLKPQLLSDDKGETKLYWEGNQCYFLDPDGNVLEMLVRFPEDQNKKWYDVGEVGLPSKNVDELKKELLTSINNHFQEKLDDFRFFGDEKGVFVLTKEGRPWYPTERPASVHPLEVYIAGSREEKIQSKSYPYTIVTKKEWDGRVPVVQMRIARPTDKLKDIIQFYEKGLGLVKVGGFKGKDHHGYEGVMYGLPGTGVHLEFTTHEEGTPCPAPTEDNLLVLYIPDKDAIEQIFSNLKKLGYLAVESENPYWDADGVTIEDPDGWRLVLMNTVGIG